MSAMNKIVQDGILLVTALALSAGLSACAPDEATTSAPADASSNLSDRSVNAGLREGGVNTNMVVLPGEYKESRPFWNYKLDENGMKDSQILVAPDRVIAVKPMQNESKYRIVIINSRTGQTLLDAHTPAYSEFNQAILTQHDGVDYLNIVSAALAEPENALSKGGGQALMSYVDLSVDEPTIEETSAPLGGLHPTVEKSATISDSYSGYAYAKSKLSHEEYAFAYPQGAQLVHSTNIFGYEPSGIVDNELIYARSGTMLESIFKIGDDIDIFEIIGSPRADQLFWAKDDFILVGSGMYSDFYLVDLKQKKVIIHIDNGNNAPSAEDIQSMESYDVSDNRQYVVFGNYAVNVAKGQYVDMTESDTSQSVTFTHAKDDGTAYGMAVDGTVAVTLKIPQLQTETNSGDSTQEFGVVRDSFDDGSLLVESGNDIFVLTAD